MSATRLRPFFPFYGAKHRAARLYPSPSHDVIVEPFAGSAAYSVLHHDRQVVLRDADPIVSNTWRYLIETPAEQIAALPLILPGQPVEELDVSPSARLLIGWWLNKATRGPCRTLSAWALQYPDQFWGERMRDRIATQVGAIRHWRISTGSYDQSPDVEATWFIDPPYQEAGRYYRLGSRALDYAALAAWAKTRRGQLIVCENEGATWLPFRPLATTRSTEGRNRPARTRVEVIYP